ncbi:hypothetical protein [Streptomyces sp. GbtcB6]|uniref:hypothetical protein n=1 Tax=Streptomyces sp. GbtcB6 TaxID=2824751 RepID=UPI001C2FF609|nr:hypothetical protein [Streptomyces sp. GbtcB6]
MDGTAITIIILAIAGVVTLLIFVLKGVLDQLPDLFESARKAREAWEQLTKKNDEAPRPDETEEQPPPVIPSADEEPPAAA